LVSVREQTNAPSYRIGYEGALRDVALPISARIVLPLPRARGAAVIDLAIVVAEHGHARCR
jgi:hypothetical protein